MDALDGGAWQIRRRLRSPRPTSRGSPARSSVTRSRSPRRGPSLAAPASAGPGLQPISTRARRRSPASSTRSSQSSWRADADRALQLAVPDQVHARPAVREPVLLPPSRPGHPHHRRHARPSCRPPTPTPTSAAGRGVPRSRVAMKDARLPVAAAGDGPRRGGAARAAPSPRAQQEICWPRPERRGQLLVQPREHAAHHRPHRRRRVARGRAIGPCRPPRGAARDVHDGRRRTSGTATRLTLDVPLVDLSDVTADAREAALQSSARPRSKRRSTCTRAR